MANNAHLNLKKIHLWESISNVDFLSFAMETAPENDPLCLLRNSLAFFTNSSSLSVAEGGHD